MRSSGCHACFLAQTLYVADCMPTPGKCNLAGTISGDWARGSVREVRVGSGTATHLMCIREAAVAQLRRACMAMETHARAHGGAMHACWVPCTHDLHSPTQSSGQGACVHSTKITCLAARWCMCAVCVHCSHGVRSTPLLMMPCHAMRQPAGPRKQSAALQRVISAPAAGVRRVSERGTPSSPCVIVALS